ncbi:MAG: helix-turn-helix transcriptional regulator [Alphaproteobacteria bacterium]|nr:helix-turn-helix transcriptional regulator [Alphaproteobacteria bacterium]
MDMSLARRLADNLRKRRSGKTQEVFARKLGISRVSLTRIENAEQNVSLKTLQQLCKALKCDIGDLF